MKGIKRFWQCEAGNATEYALILAIVSMAIFTGAGILGSGLAKLFKAANNAFGF